MVDWQVHDGLIDYAQAVATMEQRVSAIRLAQAEELVWLVEHPPLYTKGTSARDADLLDKNRFPIYETGRGGEFTYHGPGQRIAYVMLDLEKRGKDIRRYVQQLEQWIILTLAQFGIEGFIREGRVGVWVMRGAQEAKIAAIGIRVRRWVSYHGIAINLNPQLSHFSGIVPCGIREYGVTSLAEMGIDVSMPSLDQALADSFSGIFGQTANNPYSMENITGSK